MTFQELITILRNPDRTTGQTIFVVGGAAQGKSRLATEVAAALLRADRPCVFLRRRELYAYRDVNDPQELALKYVREHYADHFRDLVNQRTLPFIIDGWNEIEELYWQHRVYSSLIEIIWVRLFWNDAHGWSSRLLQG